MLIKIIWAAIIIAAIAVIWVDRWYRIKRRPRYHAAEVPPNDEYSPEAFLVVDEVLRTGKTCIGEFKPDGSFEIRTVE